MLWPQSKRLKRRLRRALYLSLIAASGGTFVNADEGASSTNTGRMVINHFAPGDASTTLSAPLIVDTQPGAASKDKPNAEANGRKVQVNSFAFDLDKLKFKIPKAPAVLGRQETQTKQPKFWDSFVPAKQKQQQGLLEGAHGSQVILSQTLPATDNERPLSGQVLGNADSGRAVPSSSATNPSASPATKSFGMIESSPSETKLNFRTPEQEPSQSEVAGETKRGIVFASPRMIVDVEPQSDVEEVGYTCSISDDVIESPKKATLSKSETMARPQLLTGRPNQIDVPINRTAKSLDAQSASKPSTPQRVNEPSAPKAPMVSVLLTEPATEPTQSHSVTKSDVPKEAGATQELSPQLWRMPKMSILDEPAGIVQNEQPAETVIEPLPVEKLKPLPDPLAVIKLIPKKQGLAADRDIPVAEMIELPPKATDALSQIQAGAKNNAAVTPVDPGSPAELRDASGDVASQALPIPEPNNVVAIESTLGERKDNMLGVTSKIGLSVSGSKSLFQRDRIVKVSVENPSIVQAVTTGSDNIVLIGRKSGSTRLAVWTDSTPNLQPLVYQVDVDSELNKSGESTVAKKLTETLRSVLGNNALEVVAAENGFTIRGNAESESQARRALQVVRSACLRPVNDQVVVR